MLDHKYSLQDANHISWNEFGELMNILCESIIDFTKKTNISFDAISPILRNGAIPGTIIANRLEIITYLPVQVKYDYAVKKPIQMLPFSKSLVDNIGDKPNILVVDCNTSSGESAKLSADIIKQTHPDANLYYATVAKVYNDPEIALNMYHECFYAVMTNENYQADAKTENELKLRPGVAIFPWEDAKRELDDLIMGNE